MSFYYARKKFPLQYTFLLYGIGCRGYGLGKKRRDLVQRRWRNKGWSRFVHQVRARGFGKKRGDLVQRRRKNKGWRGFVHQVKAPESGKRREDLVQRRRKDKGWRGFVHQVPVRGERKKPKEPFCACNPLSYIENYPGKCYTSTKFCKE